MSRTLGLVLASLAIVFMAYALVLAQADVTLSQLRNQLELVKASRDFIERASAQAVSSLEEELAHVKTELARCTKPKEVEGATP
jgi:hypothetical protein